MSFNWVKEAELSLKSVSSAAEIIETQYKNMNGFRTKESPRDIVTELDIAIEHYLVKELSVSGYHIIGEETTSDEDLGPYLDQPVWYLDPIDGTTNFISSVPFYAISAGLGVGFDFVVGTVILPALREIYFISDIGTSFVNGKLLWCDNANLKNSLLAMAFPTTAFDIHLRKKQYEIFGYLNDHSRGCLRTGSAAINICYAASGRIQAAVGFANKIWDIAGGLAIARGAHCKIYLEWIKGSNRFNYIVGSDGVTQEIAEYFRKNKIADIKPISDY